MELSESAEGNLVDVIEDATRNTWDYRHGAKKAVRNFKEQFLIVGLEDLPEVTENSKSYYESNGSRMVPQTSDPDELERKALGLLAIAAKRRKDIKQEDAELGPLRMKYTSVIWPNKIITGGTYHDLSTDERHWVNLMVALEVKNQELQAQLDKANTEL